jgi:transposase
MIVRNQLSDFRQLAGYLKRLEGALEIALEPTADYHRKLAYFLKAQDFAVKLVSLIAVARTREVLHNSWDKNDPKDAQVILHLLRNGNTQYFYDPVVEQTNNLQGTIEDPLSDFVVQDSRATQFAQPLSTALLSRGRAVPVQ